MIANWIAEEVETNKPETVKTYLAALRNHHIEGGFPTDAFDDPRITRVIKGSLRIQGTRPIRQRLDITKDVLLAIVNTLSVDHDSINLHAAFCVAFAAFLRPSEFTWDTWNAESSSSHLSRQSIKFTTKGVLLLLPKSKTDQYRKGHTIPLAFSNDATCPVNSLKTLITKYPKPRSDPLFTRLSGSFNKRWLSYNLALSLRQAGYDPTHYSGHSFRRGVANTAIAVGIPRDDIKTLGRWKSDAVDKYFSDYSKNAVQFDINQKLHLAPPGRKPPLTLRTPKSNSCGEL